MKYEEKDDDDEEQKEEEEEEEEEVERVVLLSNIDRTACSTQTVVVERMVIPHHPG